MAEKSTMMKDYLFRVIVLFNLIILLIAFSFSGKFSLDGDEYPELLDTVLNGLKIIGLSVAGVAGVIGVFADYKDKEGNLKISGFVAITIIVSSSFLAVLAQGIENYTKSKSDNRQKLKTELLLRDLSRVLDPLQEVDLFAEVFIDLSGEVFRGYADRVAEQSGSLKVEYTRNKYGYPMSIVAPGVSAFLVDEGRPHTIQIKENSALYPKSNTERAAYEALRFIEIILSVRHSNANNKDNERGSRPDGNPKNFQNSSEMRFSTSSGQQRYKLNSSDESTSKTEWPLLLYNIPERRFFIQINTLRSESKDWSGGKSIRSLIDLYNKEITIRLNRPFYDSEITDYMDKYKVGLVRKTFRLSRIILTFNQNRSLRITVPEELIMNSDSGFYKFKFPADLEGDAGVLASIK